jgi:hypothetical protein
MNLSDKQKQWVMWFVVVLLIAVMGFLGIQNPIPVPPTPETARPAPAATLAPDAFARFGSVETSQLRVKTNEEHTGLETHSGAETHTGANTFGTMSSTYLTSTNVISMTGATFTGPLKYGTVATYTTGSAITHGFVSTPTMCLMFPSRDVTETLTLATTTFASDRASQASPIYWACGK